MKVSPATTRLGMACKLFTGHVFTRICVLTPPKAKLFKGF
jgi:hypothetical protein